MGPVREMLMSDQPILEYFVRSTAHKSAPTFAHTDYGVYNLTLVLLPFVNALEIIDTGVVEVLSGEDDAIHISRVGISNRMSVGIPATVA